MLQNKKLKISASPARLDSAKRADGLNTKKGFTLIEALTVLFVFSIITVTFYEVWSVGTRYILLAKGRLVANALANEKMEIIRNMDFEDVAHTTGSPAGNLLQDEDIIRSGRTFHVFTQIKNEDDPYDGTFLAGTDIVSFVDYKHVKITISWNDGSENQSISTSARFVPAGIEQPAAGKGVLVINVTSDKAGGASVANSSVRIRNASTGFDETHNTDINGRLLMFGIDQAIKAYEITLEKPGYETVSTLEAYPGGLYSPPVWEHASVIEGALSTIDMFQNELADLKIKTVDYLDTAIPDIDFHLEGGRKLGLDPLDSTNEIWNMDGDWQTGSSGEKEFSNISPGNYSFTLDPGETGYEVISTDPENPAPVLPDSDATFTVRLADKSVTSLLVNVTAVVAEETVPISGATVRLENGAGGYDKNINSVWNGNAYFPVSPDTVALAPGTYNLVVSASGYEDNTSTVTISDGTLNTQTIMLTAS